MFREDRRVCAGANRTGDIHYNYNSPAGRKRKRNDRLYDQCDSMAALARSAMASPGGKLSSEARLMRNGEIDQFYMQFVEKVQFERLYILI